MGALGTFATTSSTRNSHVRLVASIGRGGNHGGDGGSALSALNDTLSDTSSSLMEWWFTIPQVGRFAASGCLGNIIFFIIHRALCYYAVSSASAMDGSSEFHDVLSTPSFRGVVSGKLPVRSTKLIPEHATYYGGGRQTSTSSGAKLFDYILQLIRDNMEAATFLGSYLILIIPQHALNALLVFGLRTIETRHKYWVSLKGAYAAYSITMIGSTVLNTFLLRHQISRNVAFFGTLCGFAFINFILLSMWDNKSNRGEDNEGAEICFSKEKFGFESNHHSTQQSWQQRQQQEFRQQQKREDGRMGWVTETSKFLKMPRTRKKMDKIANFARGGAQLLSRISSCSPPKSLNYPASLAACSSSSLRSDAVMNDDKISCAKRSSGSILFTCCNVTIDAKTGKDELLRFVHCTGKKTNIL